MKAVLNMHDAPHHPMLALMWMVIFIMSAALAAYTPLPEIFEWVKLVFQIAACAVTIGIGIRTWLRMNKDKGK